MSTITKQWLQQKIADMEARRDDPWLGLDEDESNTLEALRIALASLEAEAAYFINRVKHSDSYGDDVELRAYCYELDALKSKDDFGGEIVPVYTYPPAPVVPPEQNWEELCRQHPDMSIGDAIIRASWWNLCRAAMLQGGDTELQRKAAIHDALCEKYNVESLADFVDWQRNHITELEAAPPAPVGEGETAVMPDYPGYVMTQRECYQAGKKAGLAELVTTAYTLPPHTYRELVNRLRDTAVKYHGCQQLREQLSRTLQEVIEPEAPQQEAR